MLPLIQFLRRESNIEIPRLVFHAAVAGLSNAVILGILNLSASAAVKGEPPGELLALLVVACITYWITQRYLFVTTMAHIESALHRYRLNQVSRVLHSDLDALERIGPARIFGALTRLTQTISTAASPIVLGLQSVVIIFFTLIYLSLLSVYGAILTVLILGFTMVMARIRWARAYRMLHQIAEDENSPFDSVTDLIEGFKEVRLNIDRSADLHRYIEDISLRVTAAKGDIDRRLSQLFLFSQISFFVAAAAMIYVLPGLSPVFPHDLLKTTTVIIFLVGPVAAVTGSSAAIAQATAAVRGLLELEEALTSAAGRSESTGQHRTAFSEIRLHNVVYRHGGDDTAGFTLGPVSISVRRGELIFIMGGNGSGKTTLRNLLQGDFGTSWRFQEPALPLVLERIPATVELAIAALVLSLAIAIPLGVFAAVRRNTVFDGAAMVFALIGQSAPAFWIGIMLILVFAVRLGVLPTSGREGIESLVLPAVTLALTLAGRNVRLVRSSMLEVLNEDYIRTARAKGLPEWRVIGKHALRNALLPVVTVVGLELGHLLGGAVIVETVFAWPGIGLLAMQAVLGRDYPIVQAVIIISALVFVLVNLAIDLLYGWLDPRITLGRA